MGLSHTKRREENSRAAQGVWQDAVMTLYEIPVKCWVYLQTHTHTDMCAWKSTVCFLETGVSSHCFTRFSKPCHPETGKTLSSPWHPSVMQKSLENRPKHLSSLWKTAGISPFPCRPDCPANCSSPSPASQGSLNLSQTPVCSVF